jgi:hypothetical protein
MRIFLIALIVFASCNPNKVQPDTVLPVLQSQLIVQNDSLQKVKTLVLKYGNLYVNDINNKEKQDSMEYWSQVQKELLENIASTKYSIDSLEKIQKQ